MLEHLVAFRDALYRVPEELVDRKHAVARVVQFQVHFEFVVRVHAPTGVQDAAPARAHRHVLLAVEIQRASHVQREHHGGAHDELVDLLSAQQRPVLHSDLPKAMSTITHGTCTLQRSRTARHSMKTQNHTLLPDVSS